MAKNRDWVDYTNLAANVVQTAQLDGINSKMRQLAELELQKEYRDQQEAAVAKREDLLREAVFIYSEQLRNLEDMAKSNPVTAYIRANHLKRLYADIPQFKASGFRKFEDKERLANTQRAYDGLIRQCARQLSSDELESSDRCITHIFEREKLVHLIAAQEKWAEFSGLKESVAKQITPKLAALQKLKDEQQRNVRPFWKKIFGGGKSELDIQAEAIELEIRSMNQDVEKAEAGFGQHKINYYMSFFTKFSDVKMDDYKNLLRERDALMNQLLGEDVKGVVGEDYSDSLDNQSPSIRQQNDHVQKSVSPAKKEVEGALSALAEWIRIGSGRTGVYIFGSRLANGGYNASTTGEAFSDLEQCGLLPKGSANRSDTLDQMVNSGYTFIIIKVPGDIEVIGRVPVETTLEQQESAAQYLGLEKHQKVKHRTTQSGTSRELDVNYVLYGN